MKKIFLFLFSTLIFLLLVITVNTLRFSSKQISGQADRKYFPVDSAAVRHLSSALKFRTISFDEDSLIDHSQFDSLTGFLQTTYPLSFSKLETKIIGHSLLMKWKGLSNVSPAILYAHLDVVPADDSASWKHHPFAGETDSSFIFGRGAIDDKGSVISILESVEALLQKNFQPKRDIYLAFGHDEEAGGNHGAVELAFELAGKNVKAEFLLDEGGLVATDMVPFVKPPVALIFTSEKGYLTLKLRVKGSGGHSSFPPPDAPVEILSEAIHALHSHPFEKRMSESVSEFMDYAGPEMRMPFRALFANRWLFKPVIFGEYEKIPSANAMIRTTSVATVIQGGSKENVIPSEVFVKINFRLLPGDDSKSIIEKVREIIGNQNIAIEVLGKPEEPSTVSSTASEGFLLLKNAVSKTFPDAVVSPSLLIAQTDSRHFRNVTKNIYRFLPVRMNDEILDSMHGRDEKISISDFMEAISFYKTLISSL